MPDTSPLPSKPCPPWVALHGFTGSGLDFEPFLHGIGAPVHAPDLPGHGAAALQPSSLEATLDRLVPFIRSRGPCNLLGYSLGGRLALQIALRRPSLLTGLVLVGANAGIETAEGRRARRQQDDQLARRIEAEGVGAFTLCWADKPIISSQRRIPAPWRDAMRQRRLTNSAPGLAASLRGLGQGSVPPVWSRLREIRIPVLLLTGAEDSKYTRLAARMHALLPNAEHVVIAGAGHCAHLEQPVVAAQTLRGWAARQSSDYDAR